MTGRGRERLLAEKVEELTRQRDRAKELLESCRELSEKRRSHIAVLEAQNAHLQDRLAMARLDAERLATELTGWIDDGCIDCGCRPETPAWGGPNAKVERPCSGHQAIAAHRTLVEGEP